MLWWSGVVLLRLDIIFHSNYYKITNSVEVMNVVHAGAQHTDSYNGYSPRLLYCSVENSTKNYEEEYLGKYLLPYML